MNIDPWRQNDVNGAKILHKFREAIARKRIK